MCHTFFSRIPGGWGPFLPWPRQDGYLGAARPAFRVEVGSGFRREAYLIGDSNSPRRGKTRSQDIFHLDSYTYSCFVFCSFYNRNR